MKSSAFLLVGALALALVVSQWSEPLSKNLANTSLFGYMAARAPGFTCDPARAAPYAGAQKPIPGASVTVTAWIYFQADLAEGRLAADALAYLVQNDRARANALIPFLLQKTAAACIKLKQSRVVQAWLADGIAAAAGDQTILDTFGLIKTWLR
jgi:hypothetical protein